MKCIVVGSEVYYLLVGEFEIMVFGFGGYSTFWILQENIRIYPTFQEHMNEVFRRLKDIIESEETEE